MLRIDAGRSTLSDPQRVFEKGRMSRDHAGGGGREGRRLRSDLAAERRCDGVLAKITYAIQMCPVAVVTALAERYLAVFRAATGDSESM